MTLNNLELPKRPISGFLTLNKLFQNDSSPKIKKKDQNMASSIKICLLEFEILIHFERLTLMDAFKNLHNFRDLDEIDFA